MKTTNIIIASIVSIASSIVCHTSFAQDAEVPAAEEPAPLGPEIVKSTFEHSVLINNQTVESGFNNMIDLIIHHRFGSFTDGDGKADSYDLFGLYKPSNIRLGINYGISDVISVGVGATKNKHIYDFQGKYRILRQKTAGMPLSLTYYGDVAYNDTKPKDKFLNQDSAYKPANRLSFYHELMVARKFTSRISAQVSASYTYINLADTVKFKGLKHDMLAASFTGRYKFSPQAAAILTYSQPLTAREDEMPKPDLGVGVEISTGNHQFQVFAAAADAIINQEMKLYTERDFTKKDFIIGFNVTRQW